MAGTARSQLPITSVKINGTAVADTIIFGSPTFDVVKDIARNVTVGGIYRTITGMSANGSFEMNGDTVAATHTDDENPGSTRGDQDIIEICGVKIAGTLTASYDKSSNRTSIQFAGTIPDEDLLGEAGVVDGTEGGAYWET